MFFGKCDESLISSWVNFRKVTTPEHEGPGFDSRPAVFLHGACIFSPRACMGYLTGYSGVLPQSKNMTVRLINLSKLPLGVIWCVHGCLPCVSLCCPALDWRRVQGVPRLPPLDCRR
ncbi:hypothetical protein AMECASPLE_025137 [Ameca splendens]|uniref:Uncharacterized protein n=1 Tax=Ameca splendens TaxID=208324 RepID=A0ABV0Z3G2_9TELE